MALVSMQLGWSNASGRLASAVASAAVTSFFGLFTVWYLRRQSLQALARAKFRRCTDKEVLAGVQEVRRRYHLSETGGFLPDSCLERLPAEFDAWEAVAADLPQLNRSKALAQRVEALPVLTAALQGASNKVLQRAYILLGSLVHSYVHREEVPWHCLDGTGEVDTMTRSERKTVPRALAEPYLEVCKVLGMPPVLTSAATDLWNWQRIDPGLPFEPGNLKQRISVTGTTSERVFHMVPCAMQAAAAEVVPKIFLADVLIKGARQEELASLLWEVAEVLRNFKRLFALIPKGVDPDVFYKVYRPLLNGFHPDGVNMKMVSPENYEGITGLKLESSGLLNSCKGPSAGQSSIILLLDIFLSVSHVKAGTAFQDEMLMYMPAEHRQLILDFRARWQAVGSISDFVKKSCQEKGETQELHEAYNASVEALLDLRRFHLATVKRYLVRTSKGTGATTWRMLLQAMLDATHASLLRLS